MSKRNQRKKYKPNMNEVLCYINKFITVDKGKNVSGDPVLRKTLTKVIEYMKAVSPLFKALFETYQYAANSYDGLKIGKPNEFDLDLKLRIPDSFKIEVLGCDKTGFVRLYIKNWEELVNDQKLYSTYKELEQLKDDVNFISHLKLKQWLQDIITKAVERIGRYTKFGNLNVTNKKFCPAITLQVGDILTVNMVAIFRIPGKQWPVFPFRQNCSENQDFFAVPKGPKVKTNIILKYPAERYWRLSFLDQEQEYMFNKGFCKPAIRYLKKLNVSQKHNIPSYFIKTVFLWEIEKREASFWGSDNSTVFMEMLKTYVNHLENHSIPYFWDKSYNFLQPNIQINISKVIEYLKGVLKDIENPKDPVLVAKHILSPEEYKETCTYFEEKKFIPVIVKTLDKNKIWNDFLSAL